MCPFESGQGHQSKRVTMRIEWRDPTEKVRTYNGEQYGERKIEAWVRDYCIGRITVKWSTVQGEEVITEVNVSSAVIKTRKIYAAYNMPKDYDLVFNQALTGEHTLLKAWIVEQWKSMLEKAGIV